MIMTLIELGTENTMKGESGEERCPNAAIHRPIIPGSVNVTLVATRADIGECQAEPDIDLPYNNVRTCFNPLPGGNSERIPFLFQPITLFISIHHAPFELLL